MSNTPDNLQGTEIAIIGMSGRFPGARDTVEFWRNLAGGVESISFLSDEELLAAGVPPHVIADPGYVKARGVLQDAELFDAAFFGFTPKQAEILDPQHRLFLECAWEALESAGYDPQRYGGSIGVYAGKSLSSYLQHNLSSRRDVLDSVGGLEVLLANDKDHLATGVSYKLNLRGPSISVQTACSTSLVAVHVACQSLLHRECDMALAGGVSIVFPQYAGYVYHKGGIRSPDGHCRAFDAMAGGTIGGSGVGIVLLKNLEDALRDGDPIHAIIRGSASNNDGAVKVGYTAPSVDGQSAVIAESQSMAGVDAESITYIEAHGTGTELGDPVEIGALSQAFRGGTRKTGFCAIGSVKTNIGHLDAAAGVAGLIKTVLALENKSIPPSLHFQQPNPKIDFAHTPFFVNDRLSEWQAGATPRRAGVSSFGMGGTNAHVILEEAPPSAVSSESRSPQLLLVSAKTSTALDQATAHLAEHLRQHPDTTLADTAYTLQVGRQIFPHRRMLVCRDRHDAIAALENPDPRRVVHGFHDGADRQVVFMFTGQGAQRPNMGLELYRTEPTFRQHLDACCDAFQEHTGFDIRPVLYPVDGGAEEAARQLSQTHITQAALFAFEYALARLWMSWGIHPQAMIGHSIGEYVAACLAGVFSLEHAVALVAERGRLMGQMPRGDMISVLLPAAEVSELLSDGLSIAAINGTRSCVVSGPTESVDALEAALSSREVGSHRLHTSHAFHSAMMDPIVDVYAERVKQVRRAPPSIPFVSNVTGEWINADQATEPSYWSSHIRNTVQFSRGLEQLFAVPDRILLEVGPAATLSALAKAHSAKPRETTILSSLPHPRDQKPDGEHVLQTLGHLWLNGCRPDWAGFYANEHRQRVRLPTYPFERQRYWIAPAASAAEGTVERKPVTDWFFEPSWKRRALDRKVPAENSRWLIFSDEHGVGSAMAESLKSCRCDVVCVSASDRFSGVNDAQFGINPVCREDYDRLIRELEASDRPFDHIVHLWSVGVEGPYDSDPAQFARSQQRGFFSLLYLVQALNDAQATDPLHLTVGTSQVQDVNGQELLCPDKATVLGPAMTIGAEFPHITCVSVDVPLANPQDAPVQARNLLAEAAAGSTDPVVAYRGRYRWIQSFQPAPLPPVSSRPARLRERGTYLITGGLGGMGLALAEYLARTVRARLVLVGRTGLPPQEKWDEYADPEDGSSTARQIRRLKAIEDLGGEVLLCRADVSDKQQMSEALDTARRRFGALNGVIHAAGVPGGGVLLRQTAETVQDVFAAKVQGTRVLDQLLRNEPLDFLVFCSSRLSLFGVAGRAEYAAANRFMDVFARRCASRDDRFVTAINWDTWQEAGMSVQSRVEQDGTRREVQPELGMTTLDGIDVFSRILDAHLPQVAVSLYGLKPDASRSELGSVSSSSPAGEPRPARASHPRPEMHTDYEAPRSETERKLAAIWQEVSGIESIGIRDNFFELGGDSVIALQIVAKANQAGLKLTIRHVLERQTIAELADVAGTTTRFEAEQGVVTGPVPLTPIQHWLFEKDLAEPHFFNQSVLLEELRPVDHSLLRQAVQHVLVHHDALRLRYAREASSRWRQFITEPGEAAIDRVDLSSVPEDRIRPAIAEAATQLQRSLNLFEGPLFRVACFDLGPNRRGRWLIVIHHLAVDIISWRILLEDIQAAYQSLSEKRSVALPPKTMSFKQWSERLSEHAQSPAVSRELDDWVTPAGDCEVSLPVDLAEGDNTYGSIDSVSASLTPQETQAVLQHARAAYDAQTDELLLTAAVQAFSHWTGQAAVRLELEGHGREEFIEGVDVSRTVGWFTTIYPVTLRLETGVALEEAIKAIRGQLRAVPHHGLNYGLLRYLSQDGRTRLADAPRPEVGFLYLGAVDHTGSPSSLFAPAEESPGLGQSPNNVRPHVLEIVARVESEQLRLSWTFSRNLHRRETIETLNRYFLDSLRAIIHRCQSPAARLPTPSEFPLAKIDQPALDRLAGSNGSIEDVYPLSPMQQGLLFHTLYGSESNVYCQKVACTFRGGLNVPAMQKAWQSVVDRHPVLRSAYHWEHLDEPLQVVHRSVTLSWRMEDWRGRSADEQQRQRDSFLRSDQQQGFDLKQPPLMRLSLFHLADDVHYFHWSFHHVLLDGWCINLVLKEMLAFYQSHCEHTELPLARPRPFRDYIAWLHRQDLHKAEAFWRDNLKGFARPTRLNAAGMSSRPHNPEKHFDHQHVRFSKPATDALLALGTRHKLTLSTLFHGAWALVLSQRGGERDIVFGSVVSGHSTEIEGMESMVGLFMNTLPMRALVDPEADLHDWLGELQSRHAELREYAYTPLVDIQKWSEVVSGTPLFESILSFRNQPLKVTLEQSLAGLDVQADDFSNPSHYPVTVEGTVDRTLWFRIVHDCRRFDSATIAQVLGQLENYLSSLSAQLDSRPTIGQFLAIANRQLQIEQEKQLDDVARSKLRRATRRQARTARLQDDADA